MNQIDAQILCLKICALCSLKYSVFRYSELFYSKIVVVPRTPSKPQKGNPGNFTVFGKGFHNFDFVIILYCYNDLNENYLNEYIVYSPLTMKTIKYKHVQICRFCNALGSINVIQTLIVA